MKIFYDRTISYDALNKTSAILILKNKESYFCISNLKLLKVHKLRVNKELLNNI